MDDGYQFVDLSGDDLEQIRTMERKLTDKYDREIVLIAYEKPGKHAHESPIESGRPDDESPKRGPTFGFTDAQFDHHPTLASVMGQDLAGGEDLRFGDVEPPEKEE